jgi:photosystem II stability/assembly factor-like uncharacterized protein
MHIDPEGGARGQGEKDRGETGVNSQKPRFGLRSIALAGFILAAGIPATACGGAPAEATASPEAGCPYDHWTVIARADFPRTTLSVMFADAAYGIATDTGGGIYATEDAGVHWTHAYDAGYSRVALDMMNPGAVWHIGFGGALSRSVDRGRSWEYVGSVPYNGHVEYVSFANEADGWVVSSEIAQLFQTGDGGRSWVALPLPEGMGFPAAINLRTPEEGRLLDTAGRLFLSTDGGATWSEGSIPLGDGWVLPTLNHSAAMRFLDADHGLLAIEAVTEGDGRTFALRTADGGRTWEEESLPVPMGMFHLTRDGIYLTHVDLIDQSQITILCRNP